MTSRPRSRTRRTLALAVLAGALVLAAVALAATFTITTGTATVNGAKKTVVVDPSGKTLYALSDERVGNLKCLTQACFAIWPPLKVGANDKLTKPSNVKGTLGKLRRVKGGFYQVMLNGRPLYRFSGDSAKGQAKGDGIRSYGGTWRVVTP